ncbi:MAG: hypothetical protein CMQ51_06665 [Gammaproteobacteria bacterium]|nr:hypothetical protein [Gammaproteobacteria bacterium]|tara:strand:- start:467 stop:1654 length:1188 start_codon:yes stop_codon:yes gene_type:complete
MIKIKNYTLLTICLSFVAISFSACSDIELESDRPNNSLESAISEKLEFSSFDINSTNRGTIKINGFDRHFSVTFPTSYDSNKSYPVVLFFHGCMCRPDFTEESILSYLDWAPRLESYKSDFITVKMSAFSEKKPEEPQGVENGGARGMWFWHKGLESERDDYAFVNSLLEQLDLSPDINIDPSNIFGWGHSSGAIFLISYVLGGPVDLTNIEINNAYKFKAISVTGGSTLRKGIVDFKENTPTTLPSVLHIQGEEDGGLWFNGHETGKSDINFLQFASVSNGINIIDGLRDTIHGLTYSAWDENTPSNPSTLERWSYHLGLEYSGYEEYNKYYLYNFTPINNSKNILIGLRIKNCGHRLTVDQFQSSFFRAISDVNTNIRTYKDLISSDTSINLC